MAAFESLVSSRRGVGSRQVLCLGWEEGGTRPLTSPSFLPAWASPLPTISSLSPLSLSLSPLPHQSSLSVYWTLSLRQDTHTHTVSSVPSFACACCLLVPPSLLSPLPRPPLFLSLSFFLISSLPLLRQTGETFCTKSALDSSVLCLHSAVQVRRAPAP